MNSLIERIIAELNLGGVINKQRSINKLFPPFQDRVKDVSTMGGLRMVSARPQLWYFQVHSGTKTNKWYDQVLRFKDIDKVIKDKAKNRMLWKPDKSGVDIRLLAREVLQTCDLELRCSCPAFQYWGPAYILTQRDAKYKPPETRRPRIRNPKEYGAVCKHYQLLLDYLFSYGGTMETYLQTFYAKQIADAEDEARVGLKGFQKVAKDLTGKEVKPEVEPVEVEPEEEPEVTPEAPRREVQPEFGFGKDKDKQMEFDFDKEPEEEEEKPTFGKAPRKEVQPEFDFDKRREQGEFDFNKPETPPKEEEAMPKKKKLTKQERDAAEKQKSKEEAVAVEDLVRRIQAESDPRNREKLRTELKKYFDLGR